MPLFFFEEKVNVSCQQAVLHLFFFFVVVIIIIFQLSVRATSFWPLFENQMLCCPLILGKGNPKKTMLHLWQCVEKCQHSKSAYVFICFFSLSEHQKNIEIDYSFFQFYPFISEVSDAYWNFLLLHYSLEDAFYKGLGFFILFYFLCIFWLLK